MAQAVLSPWVLLDYVPSVVAKVALGLVPARLLPVHLSVSCLQFSILVNSPLIKSAFCSQSIASLNKTLRAWLLLVNCPSHWPHFQRGGLCGRLLLGIAGSNRAGGMDICLLWVFGVRYGSLQQADHSSGGFLPNVVCLSVIVNPR